MSTEMIARPSNQILPDSDNSFLPALSLDKAKHRYAQMLAFVESQMKKGLDYGEIPGSTKPTLFKPGAEKLATFFGLDAPEPVIVEEIQDWRGQQFGEPFFYYKICQNLSRNGRSWGHIASCNSWEAKYRYRWVQPHAVPKHLDPASLRTQEGTMVEFEFAIQKAETTGQYGKPAEYWRKFQNAVSNGQAKKIMKKTRKGEDKPAWQIDGTLVRIPNEDIFSEVNTILSMAQKRAYVGAVLKATNASEYFTQELEDHVEANQEEARAQRQDRPAEAHTQLSDADFAERSAKLTTEYVRKMADYFQEGPNPTTKQNVMDLADTLRSMVGQFTDADLQKLRANYSSLHAKIFPKDAKEKPAAEPNNDVTTNPAAEEPVEIPY